MLKNAEWEFDHISTRELIYELLGKHAIAIHLAVAKHLLTQRSPDLSQVAFHYRAAGENKQHLYFQIREAQQCLAQGFFRQARGLLEEAWILRTRETDSLFNTRFHYHRGLAYYFTGDYERCLRIIERMKKEIDDQKSLDELNLLAAKCLGKSHKQEDFRAASDILLASIPGAVSRNDPLLLGRLYSELFVAFAHQNRFSEANACFEIASSLLESSGGSAAEVARHNRKCVIVYEPEFAEQALVRSRITLANCGFLHEELKILTNLSSVYFNIGNLSAAANAIESALGISATIGDYGLEYLLNNLGILRHLHGNHDEAIEHYLRARNLTHRIVCVVCIENNLAVAYAALGNFGSAQKILEKLKIQVHDIQENDYIIPIHINLALTYLKLGRPSDALAAVSTLPDSSSRRGQEGIQRRRQLHIQRLAYQELRIPLRFPADTIPKQHTPLILASEYALLEMEFWGD
jgi:tetratricopeptide (TPR) repeat protein